MTISLTRRQHEYAWADTPRVSYVGGCGSGKTFAGCHRVLVRAKPRSTYLVVAPTYTMLADVIVPPLLHHARSLHYLRGFSISRMSVSLGNGATVLLRSADKPDRLRGVSVAGAWLDEASYMAEDVLDVVRLRLRETPGAWLAATMTPRGRSHWTYRVFGQPSPDLTHIHAPTYSNPFLPDDFVAIAQREFSGLLARQELGGEFVESRGAEWPAECWGDWVLVAPRHMPALDRYVCRVVAVDPSLGRTDRTGDYSAIIRLGISDGLLWVQSDLKRRRPDAIVRDTIGACVDFKPHWVGIEANQFQELLVTEFTRASRGRFGVAWPVCAIKNTVNKAMRIRRLGPYIVRRELRIADDEGGRLLLDQLRDFPEGQHDDGPDALEMAQRLILEMGGAPTDGTHD